tara:strand:+ start:86129 stop:87121 length:993 start_codon:yes stop_codon:yes gene_type:complete
LILKVMQEQMNVLMNSYPVAFACPGGGEVQLLRTKEFLEKQKVHVELFDQWNPQFESSDLAHYFSVQGGSMNFCGYVSGMGMPLVISPILWPHQPEKYPFREIQNLLNTADLIFPNSQMEADLLARVYDIPLDKFHVTYNGVDDSFITDNSTTEALFRDKFHIDFEFSLCVANIENRKNQILLAQAAKSTQKNVILIGQVRDEEYLRKVKDAGGDYIHYVGALDHFSLELKSAFRACDQFILPSLLETPGLAALEAAAMGCAVAVTVEGSTKEYFGEYVTYIDPLDVRSIEQALENPKFSSDLKLHVSENFNWSRTAEQCIDGYSRLLKK